MDDKNTDKIISHINRLDDRFTNRLEIYHNEIVEFKDEVHNRMDEVMGELKKVREEQLFSANRIGDLEDRVGVIEKVPVIAHSIKK